MRDENRKADSTTSAPPEENGATLRDIGGGLSIVLGIFSWLIPILIGAGTALMDSHQLAYLVQSAKLSLFTSQISLILAAGAATLGLLGLFIYKLSTRFLVGLSIASLNLIFRFL